MEPVVSCGRGRRALAGAALSLLLVCGCSSKNAAYPVASAGQGGAVVREEPNAPRPPRETVAPSSPTPREISQQKKIEELEAQSRALQDQSKALQAEVERLKREQK